MTAGGRREMLWAMEPFAAPARADPAQPDRALREAGGLFALADCDDGARLQHVAMRVTGSHSGDAPPSSDAAAAMTSPGAQPSSRHGDLRSRPSTSSPPPRRGFDPGASARVGGPANEIAGLMAAGGAAMLQQGVQTGFQSLPAEYRGLGLQTARLVGLMPDGGSQAAQMPFAQLAPRLSAVAQSAAKLVDATRLDLAAALTLDPQQRAAMLSPHLSQLKDAGRMTADAIAQMPVADLLANKQIVKEELTAWTGSTETLHEQLKAQLGEAHPATVMALEARTEASAAYGKTMLRMAAARLGSAAFNLTVGPLVGGLARWLGTGN
jgi:hypothetical protein